MVIARSKDLILVPEPDMHKDEHDSEQEQINSTNLSVTKEVFFYLFFHTIPFTYN